MTTDSHLSQLWARVEDSGRADKPDFWIRRKGVVIIVLGLSVYTFYVAVGRTLAPAIQQRRGSAYPRVTGIGLLVGFVALWLMFMWSYCAIISTAPGYARDVVPMTPKPLSPREAKLSENVRPAVATSGLAPVPIPTHCEGAASASDFDGVRPPSPVICSGPHAVDPPACRHSDALAPLNQPEGSLGKARYVPRPSPVVDYGPRWCQYCKIVKPDRTHHCRHCGACVLQFDHHCIWIGRCVGWNNHAVFLTFTFWAGLFCLYSAVVLIIDVAKSDGLDGQKIAIICVAGFLALFTAFMMLPTHVYLILKGRSTVESFQSSSQLKAEQSALENEFQSKCLTAEMRHVRRQWEVEYGGVAVNDRWAFGRKREMWKREMGPSWIGWLLPIGRPQGDGIHFPSNPRFGPNGEWLPMRDWPKVVAL